MPTRHISHLFLIIYLALALVGCRKAETESKPSLEDKQSRKQGMVVSADTLASDAGVEMLEKGGNAVDAAVATAFAISVVEPFSAGIGGGGFLLLRLSETGEIRALDFRERAPMGASRDMYLDQKGEPIPRASLDGHLAVGVPGTVAGLYEIQQQYGKLPWQATLEPAIRFAERGFLVGERYERSARRRQEILQSNAAARAIFSKDGEMYEAGDRLIQKDLAKTLQQIAADPQSFYSGEIATAIARDMAENGGLISLEDLKAYQPVWREPLCGLFLEFQICSMPPPSSGGVHLLQILQIISANNNEPFSSLAKNPKNYTDALHLLIEAMRIAYADRSDHLGDPDFVKVPVQQLVSPEYAKLRRQEIDMERARSSQEVKPVDGETLQRLLQSESEDTSHLTVADENGNVVSLTFTINGRFGAGVVAAGTGILLNNEMDDFAIAANLPNMFGLLGNDANAIAPMKTPLSSMTPVIVTQGDRFYMAAGSPGGSTIITTVLRLILNVLVFDLDARAAVSTPLLHHQWFPDSVRVESGKFPPEILDDLRRRGHDIQEMPGWSNANLIIVTEDGFLEGAADPRGEGAAREFYSSKE